MNITIGLTTPNEFVDFCPRSAHIQSARGRTGSTADSNGCRSKLTPLICAIHPQFDCFRNTSSQASNWGEMVPYCLPFALAAACKPTKHETRQFCSTEVSCYRPDRPVRTTRPHNPLILQDGKLSHRRLECKQNFRQKCPQNRLRADRLAFDAEAGPGPSPNLVSRFKLNLPRRGVLPWRIHAILWRIRCWQPVL